MLKISDIFVCLCVDIVNVCVCQDFYDFMCVYFFYMNTVECMYICLNVFIFMYLYACKSDEREREREKERERGKFPEEGNLVAEKNVFIGLHNPMILYITNRF